MVVGPSGVDTGIALRRKRKPRVFESQSEAAPAEGDERRNAAVADAPPASAPCSSAPPLSASRRSASHRCVSCCSVSHCFVSRLAALSVAVLFPAVVDAVSSAAVSVFVACCITEVFVVPRSAVARFIRSAVSVVSHVIAPLLLISICSVPRRNFPRFVAAR